MTEPTGTWRSGGTEGRPAPKDDWRTPPELYARLEQEFGFTWDAACTFGNCLAPAGSYLAPWGGDAFAAPWPNEGPIWMNPPYSNLKPWLSRAREAEVRFLKGRLSAATKTSRGQTGQGSAIVIYSPGGCPPRYSYIPARLPAQASLLE